MGNRNNLYKQNNFQMSKMAFTNLVYTSSLQKNTHITSC